MEYWVGGVPVPLRSRQPWSYNPTLSLQHLPSFSFLRFYLFVFRNRGRREKEREKNINVWLSLARHPPTGDLALNSGMCPDWELNQ